MADTESAVEGDTVNVTFLRQKVFHDGTSMQVKKKDDTFDLPRRLVAGFIDEGAISKPSGWTDDVAAKNSLAVADGGLTQAPADGSGNAGDAGDGTELPSLSGKTKAELLDIAGAEGVTVKDGATNAEITAAIEANRASGAGGEEAPAS
jgi:hypothetical protein